MKMKLLLIMIFLVFISNLYLINYKEHAYYETLLNDKIERYFYGNSAPRGRILDRNGKVLVDNVGVLNIVYHKPNKETLLNEITLAGVLSQFVEECEVSTTDLKNYYLAINNNGKDLITKEEWDLFDRRKLSSEDIKNLKWERITEDKIQYSLEEEKTIFLFTKMEDGYSYQDKVLFEDVSNDFVSQILSLNIPSLSVSVSSKRIYPYGETLRSIFGSVGKIPKEESEKFLSQNYALTDIVGVSGLEAVYEKELKGKKAKYYINSDNSLTLLEEEEEGHDLILNLDIQIELELERILKEEVLLAKKHQSTLFLHDVYAMVGDPKTGGILALSGLRYVDNGTFSDITITAFSSSYAMGSVVKGASSTVGYITGGITPGKKIVDSCVKLWSEPEKCSYKKLGVVDDITALKTSSNYFQFITAIQSTGQKYTNNMKFEVTDAHFQAYRDVFASYGLGNQTEIDFPNEQTGMKGEKVAGDLLLNLAIGQYDTYTPISLLQYINTLANRGNRYALRFKKEEFHTFLNQVPLDNAYYDRILEGLYQVFHGGTASSYVNKSLNAVGKTGTSETFYDSNHDGVVDAPAINTTVIFYYPRENPTYSVVVLSPYITNDPDYQYPFTKNVSMKLTNYLPL